MIKAFILFFVVAFVFGGTILHCQTKMTIQAGMAFPSGNFSNVANTGYGACGSLEFPQSELLSLTGSIGYYYWGQYTAYYLGPANSYSDFQVMLGIRYAFSRLDVHPYMGIEVGMNAMNFSQTTSYAAISNVYEVSQARFGITPLFGIIFKINPNLNFDVNLKYTTASSEKINGITFPSNFYALNAGIQFKL